MRQSNQTFNQTSGRLFPPTHNKAVESLNGSTKLITRSVSDVAREGGRTGVLRACATQNWKQFP